MEVPTTLDQSSLLVAKDIAYIQRDINEIKLSLKDAYATKTSVAELERQTDDRLALLEHESNVWRFLSPTLSAAFSAIFTFFVIEYFTNIHK